MNLSDMRFPRQLEADGSSEIIRRCLMAHTIKLWPESKMDVPVITLSEPLKIALKKARLQGRIRYGFEPIFEKLAGEKRGIANVRRQTDAPYGDRVSRLLLFSNDGAERFYRQIEQVSQVHAPRLLSCLLDIDGGDLGHLITGKEGVIKIIMAEHKDGVSDVLRALVPSHDDISE
ncbi:MAG: hypothetical protein JW743_04140 [Deltaproteobacteria bacterium]|nr:hypothetical protein [Deltaproteobacteria bacterium]MBN2688493.1 hypothetical protein [Deltaproteobacteria bacterium]